VGSKNYHFVEIDKVNKSPEFQRLYARANPMYPKSTGPKVPLLQISPSSSPPQQEEGENDDDSIVLCESLILSEYVAERFSSGLATPLSPLPLSNCGASSLLPDQPEDRAQIRLFQEFCGSTFTYLPLLRAQDMPQLQKGLESFQTRLVDMNHFLQSHQPNIQAGSRSRRNGPFLLGAQFTLAECNVAPFVQRCCSILPEPSQVEGNDAFSSLSLHPLAICSDLGLECLQEWITAVLSRPSVLATAPPTEEMSDKRIKFQKRWNRLRLKAKHEEQQ